MLRVFISMNGTDGEGGMLMMVPKHWTRAR
jgi:hypothetical protein